MQENSDDVADRLSRYVDELVDARNRRDTVAIRGRTQMILTALDKLREAHRIAPLSTELVKRIQQEKAQTQLDLPETSEIYDNICWDCYAGGQRVFLDKRVDSVCRTCGWIQCPVCGACRDPKHGGCPDRLIRENKNLA